MDSIHIDVAGARQVGIRFDEFPDDLYADLRAEVSSLSAELFGRVEAATPELTGQLRAAERLRLFTDANRITGYVDIQGGKTSGGLYAEAGALEYGAHRSTKVKAHTMRLDHHWLLQLADPETVQVPDYTRTPDIAEHAFERGPLAEMAPEVVTRLNAVVERAVAKVNA